MINKNRLEKVENGILVYHQILLNTSQPIIIHKNGIILFANNSATRIFGFQDEEEIIGLSIFDFYTSETQMEITMEIRKSLNEALTELPIRRIVNYKGETKHIRTQEMLISYDGEPAIISIGEDLTTYVEAVFEKEKAISEMKEAQKRAEELAFKDDLTGLPNRRMFDSILAEKLENIDSKETLSVLFMDLNNFKDVNDTLGHSTGDKLIQSVAARLEKLTDNNVILSRRSGDEFTFLISDKTREEVEEFANKVNSLFQEVFSIDNHELFVSSSIGIGLYPQNGSKLEELIKKADSAMYQAKRTNKSYCFFNSETNPMTYNKLKLKMDLHKAVKNNELILHYQPQISLITGEMIGYEALLRWNHPVIGIVPPNEFIPIAEENYLIAELGEWALFEACKQTKKWHVEGLHTLPVSVNVSMKQLECSDFLGTVKKTLKETGLDGKYLKLELTESIMYDHKKGYHYLQSLKELGVQISIDDFGTGYSSLKYLLDMPIDSIKIDQYFISNITIDSKVKGLVRGFCRIGKQFGFEVIAEGIESVNQTNILTSIGCDNVQGYMYSKPLNSEEFFNYYKEQSTNNKIILNSGA